MKLHVSYHIKKIECISPKQLYLPIYAAATICNNYFNHLPFQLFNLSNNNVEGSYFISYKENRFREQQLQLDHILHVNNYILP